MRPQCALSCSWFIFFMASTALAQDPPETGDALKSFTLSDTGGYWSTVPRWDLLGAAQVETMDEATFAVGAKIQRVTPWTLLRVGIRKNVEEFKVHAAPGDEAFGTAILSPESSNVGISFRFEGAFPWLVCGAKGCAPGDEIWTRWSHGIYANVEAGTAKVESNEDAPSISGRLIPLAFSAGYRYKIEGVLPQEFPGSKIVAITGFAGATSRFIGGTMRGSDRQALFGTKDRFLPGFEFGASIQLGSIITEGKLTWVVPINGGTVDGLTHLAAQGTVTFILPWSLVAASAEQVKNDTNSLKADALVQPEVSPTPVADAPEPANPPSNADEADTTPQDQPAETPAAAIPADPTADAAANTPTDAATP